MLKHFSAIDPKMQVSTVLTLIEISEAEIGEREISVKDVEQSVGLQSGTASRNVAYWAEGHKEMNGGHNYVHIAFGTDRRRRALTMTDTGRAFLSASMSELK